MLNEEEVNFAVMVIDINDLKNVNDTFGHERGDIMIQNAANIIKKLWGNKATYRIGGDEFAVIFYDCTLERVQEEALRLEIEQEDFRKKNITDEVVLQLAAGTAMFGETSDHEYADVFRRADNAMYEDKKRKKRKGKGTL